VKIHGAFFLIHKKSHRKDDFKVDKLLVAFSGGSGDNDHGDSVPKNNCLKSLFPP
jgi:hypothetical protein